MIPTEPVDAWKLLLFLAACWLVGYIIRIMIETTGRLK